MMSPGQVKTDNSRGFNIKLLLSFHLLPLYLCMGHSMQVVDACKTGNRGRGTGM